MAPRRRIPSAAARRRAVPKEDRGAALLFNKIIIKRLNAFNAAIEDQIFPLLDDIAAQGGGVRTEPEETDARTRTDAVPPHVTRRLEALEIRIARLFDEDDLTKELEVIGKRVLVKNKNALKRLIGVDIAGGDQGVLALLDTFRAKNVARIKSLAGKQLTEITRILSDAQTPNLRVEVIRDQIRERFKVSKSRASLLARDQVLTLNADANKQRLINAGVEEYIWTTVGDHRVRDEHEELNGLRFRWDQPPAEGHPGEPIQCRCSAYPVMPELEPGAATAPLGPVA